MRQNNSQNGMTTGKILIIVAIVCIGGMVLFGGIGAAVVVPNLLASRKAANEASAIATLRSIHAAEVTYYATTGDENYGDFSKLSAANLLDASFKGTGMTKNGYTMTVSLPASAPYSKYCATAEPIEPGANANYFGVSGDGRIYRHTAPLKCSDGVLVTAGMPLN
jgi:type IV pilus assembly protein PilA